METWLREFSGLLLHFFGRATPNETYLVVALCVMFGALALSRVSTSLGAIGAFYTTGVLLTSSGLMIIIAALALLPFLGFQAWWLPLAVPAAAVLVIVLPLTVLFQKGSYVTALIGWTVTLLVVAAILTLEPIGRHAIEKGLEKTKPLERHRIETEHYK
ncbi:MAG TPA: hypothetical protein PKI68_03920 [Pontiellaceae bacterium]|nr:hypothetical protein [Pontiellaceae bacterium]